MKNCVMSICALLFCAGLGAGEPIDSRGDCVPEGHFSSFGYEEITKLASWDGLEPTHIVYVDASAPLGGDGSSWASAYQSLHDALNAESFVGEVGEIRIAGGLYRADRVNGVNTMDPNLTFRTGRLTGYSPNLTGLKRIAGGYAGRDAKNPDERDIEKYPTVFTGDLLGDDAEDYQNYSDNTKTMFETPFGLGIVEFNGITIEHARIGIWGARWMTDCTVRWCDASGDDFPVSEQDASPVIMSNGRMVGCTFHNNRSGMFGGAVKLSGRNVIANCRFIANDSSAGGAIASTVLDPAEFVVQNSLFSGNTSSGTLGGVGGAVYNAAFSPTATQFVHCTFVGNWVEDGGGFSVVATGASSLIQNCILDQNYSYAGSSPETEIQIARPNQQSPNVIEANIFSRFNEYIEADPGLPRVRMNSGAIPGFVSLLGPDGRLGTVDDDPTLGFDSAALGHSIALPDMPESWSIDIGLFDIADLDGDCDVTEPIPVDIFGNPRAVESIPGEGVYGYPADAGCAEFIPSPQAQQGQSWEFVDPLITDFSTEPIRLYVDQSRPAGGDGSSWANAFQSPSDALDIAASRSGPVEIWVAAGEYFPTTERAGIRSFRLLETVTMLGGFAGNETRADQRDWIANETVLTGDILGDDDLAVPSTFLDNAQHVVTSLGVRGGGVLDGFTIRNGGPYSSPFGPGLYWALDNGLGGGRVGGLVYLGAGDLVIRNSVLGPNCYGYTFSGTRSTPFVATRGQQANLRIETSRIVYDARGLSLLESLVPRFIHDRVGRSFLPMNDSGQVCLSDCRVEIYNGGGLIGNFMAGPVDIVRTKITTDYSGAPVVNQIVASESEQPITLLGSTVAGDSIGFRGPVVRINGTSFSGGVMAIHANGTASNRVVEFTNSVVGAACTVLGVQPQSEGSVFASNSNPGLLGSIGQTNLLFDFANNASAFFLDPLGPDGEPYTGDEDLRLAPGSPAINTGLNEFVTSDFDLDGNERIIG
ncbi:MAG: right-handed parallel beta-helix repeat-containing protein, partial [Phycisphaerales bacterium JB065]